MRPQDGRRGKARRTQSLTRTLARRTIAREGEADEADVIIAQVDGSGIVPFKGAAAKLTGVVTGGSTN